MMMISVSKGIKANNINHFKFKVSQIKTTRKDIIIENTFKVNFRDTTFSTEKGK